MFKMAIAIFLLLWLPAHAADRPVSEPDFAAYKELAQTKLDATKESLQKDREKTEVRLDNQDKRIGDLNSTLTAFGAYLTILVLLAGGVGWVSVRNRTREETRETAKKWFEENAKALAEEIAALRQRVQESHDLIEKLQHEAQSHFRSVTDGVREQGASMIAEMQKSIGNLSGSAVSGETPSAQGKDGEALEQLEQAIRRNKPEAEYGFVDWNTLAFSAWHKNDFEGAARYWKSAALATDATDVQIAQSLLNVGIALGQMNRGEDAIAVYEEVAKRFGAVPEAAFREMVAQALYNKGVRLGELKRSEEAIAAYDEVEKRFGTAPEAAFREVVAKALLNKGVRLGELKRSEEAIAAYDEVVQCFGAAPDAALREQVAKALLNKGVRLGELKRSEEALAVYDEVVQRIGAAPEAALREQVARAFNGKGFRLLCRAKEHWADGAARQADLQAAAALFERSLEDYDDKPIVWGNQAYTAFLLGQPEAARPLLRQTLQQGGERLYQGTLGDLAIHPVPSDEAFRAMLEVVWAEVKPQS